MLGGNPAAVLLDTEGLTTTQMQALAAKFNYDESIFVLPAKARAQGEDMGRPSTILTRTVHDGAKIRAHLGGRCAVMFEGTFNLC